MRNGGSGETPINSANASRAGRPHFAPRFPGAGGLSNPRAGNAAKESKCPDRYAVLELVS
jgi:hypothetical protein